MVDFFFVLSGFVIFHSYAHKLGRNKDVGELQIQMRACYCSVSDEC